MGQHYVPQHHLRKFASSSDADKIWMYDKCSSDYKLVPVKIVAQSSEFYSSGDERILSHKIEGPALEPLNNLRCGIRIDARSRRAVSVYLESMIKRVPHTRRKLIAMIPQEKKQLLARINRDPETLASNLNLTPTALLHKAEEWDQTFDSSPLSIKDTIVRQQWTSSEVINCIFQMTWRVVKSDMSSRFLTGDNPFFFDEGYGLKPPHGEFSFPFASDVALHGSWQPAKGRLVWIDAHLPHLKEINRRVVYGATRFVFYHEKATWVKTVAKNPRPSLNRIQW